MNPILSDAIAYRTPNGVQLCGDGRALLAQLDPESVDLVVTSPPFALQRKKSYGNKGQHEYVDWLLEFGRAVFPVLKPTGSFVLDLGGAYEKGRPVRSLYNFQVLIRFCEEIGYCLAEDFYWHNPAKLPSPIEWVNKRKIRVKDSVNTVWWFGKTENPKADVTKVLAPYSARMKQLLRDPERFYAAARRPSGHDISTGFGDANEGAIPPNLLQISNTESNSFYMRTLNALGRERHPARFPEAFPEFFIRFLTEPGDTVLDIFSGSNTTGAVADRLARKWISIELRRDYTATSVVRFLEAESEETIAKAIEAIESGKPIDCPAMDLAANGLEAAELELLKQRKLFA